MTRTTAKRSALGSMTAAICTALFLGLITCIGIAAPAQAWWNSPRVIVVGHGCGGGWINEFTLTYYTDDQSGTDNDAAAWVTGNDFNIDLANVQFAGETITGSFQCSNGQWRTFYHDVKRPGNGIYYDIGWY